MFLYSGGRYYCRSIEDLLDLLGQGGLDTEINVRSQFWERYADICRYMKKSCDREVKFLHNYIFPN